jgi:hypothetical protein
MAGGRRYAARSSGAGLGDRFINLASFRSLYYASNGEPSAMKRLKPFEFYRLGALHNLRDFDFEKAYTADRERFDDAASSAILALRQFELSHQEHREFRGSVNQAKELRGTMRWVYNKAKDQGFHPWMASSIRSDIVKFENYLEYDLDRLHAYEIEKVGIFDIEDLIDHADDALSSSEQEVLNSMVLQDFRAAGRCLAFDLYTACGFHCMRAVEGAARILYEVLTGQNAEADKKTLGAIAQYLDGEMTEKKYPKDSLAGLVVFNLRRVNNLYRKPIDHPQMSFNSVFEARNVFELSKSAISHVVEAIITCKFRP